MDFKIFILVLGFFRSCSSRIQASREIHRSEDEDLYSFIDLTKTSNYKNDEIVIFGLKTEVIACFEDFKSLDECDLIEQFR
jgi:hypothetical protein